jgi:hypothetical protein
MTPQVLVLGLRQKVHVFNSFNLMDPLIFLEILFLPLNFNDIFVFLSLLLYPYKCDVASNTFVSCLIRRFEVTPVIVYIIINFIRNVTSQVIKL